MPEMGKCRGKERLIQAAIQLISLRPFEEMTIEEIITNAQVSRPTFYYHFVGGKEALREELVQRGYLFDTPPQNTRLEILEAAIKVFARSGLSAATLEEIAEEAGVTRGTLTWHFHTKDDLLKAIVKQFSPHSIIRPAIEEIENEIKAGTLVEDEGIIRRIVSAFYDAFVDNKESDLARLTIFLIHTHPNDANILSEMIVKGRKSANAYITRRQDEGYFCKNISPHLFMQTIVSFFALRAISRGLSDQIMQVSYTKEELIDQLVHLLMYGIVCHEQEQPLDNTP
ncbi:MAG TPA: TetR/AcrR family transcriptional regulator [Ktedonobacteraceae bacterium]|nr:TetR/AcrR family transcriptional regulator [Ktedonobacteraceae bacterium]